MITGHGDVPLAVEAMKGGAVDFLEKPFDDEILLGAVRTALSTQATDQERQAQQCRHQGPFASLSSRERDVSKGLVAGNPNKTIAYDLGISPRTVEIYRANVMTKMQAGKLVRTCPHGARRGRSAAKRQGPSQQPIAERLNRAPTLIQLSRHLRDIP